MRVLIGATLLVTACGPGTEAPVRLASPPQEGWAVQLEALLPSIDRCIADSPSTRWVSFAGDYNGEILVRLSGDDQSVDCRVSSHSAPNGAPILVADTRPRDEALVLDGENEMIFVRAPGDNPGGECYEAPEVKSTTGTLLGWMVDPQGC